MSDDLIKRSDAIKALCADSDGVTETEAKAVMVCLADVFEVLREVPTADRPRGEWIEKYGSSMGIYECSECGNLIHSPYDDIRKKFHAWCGRCGADMRGESDGE